MAKSHEMVEAYLKRLPPDKRQIADALRALVHAVAPSLQETIKWGYPCFKGAGNVCSIMAHTNHVNLVFFRGTALIDKDRLLDGTGKGVRHVKILNVDDVRQPALAALIAEAVALDGGSSTSLSPALRGEGLGVTPDPSPPQSRGRGEKVKRAIAGKCVRLIHWKETEVEERAERLQRAGFTVEGGPIAQEEFKTLGAQPPAAIVIDLSRLPSHGREVALALRVQKSTRGIPLVFVDGDAEKVARLKELLPDAVYTTWAKIGAALTRAITQAPAAPVVPESKLAGYSGTPLPKKLGIKPDSSVLLINAPEGFETVLGQLPDGVTLLQQARGKGDLVIWFTQSRQELEKRMDAVAKMFGAAGLWIAWPKKASGIVSDVSEPVVRETGLNAGLVDYKICAIDATWSGLRFARRKV